MFASRGGIGRCAAALALVVCGACGDNGASGDADARVAAVDGGDPDGAATADAAPSADAGPDPCAIQRIGCNQTFVVGDTAGGSDDFSDYSCLPTPSVNNKELIYQFTAPADEQVVVTTSNRTGVARILVMEGSCAPASCALQNFYSVRFESLPGVDYFFAVEGWGDGNDVGYELSVLCDAPANELGSCDDGLDNDGDFTTDCIDPDCRDDATCGFGACSPAGITIDCNTRLLAGSTSDVAATDNADSYGCGALPMTLGNELAYTFVAPEDGPVLFTVSNQTAVTGIAVVADNGGCHSADCVKFQWYSTIANLTAGTTYYVLVDRQGQGTVDFDLSVVCNPPATETVCDDGIDNDGDLAIDCSDPDCGC